MFFPLSMLQRGFVVTGMWLMLAACSSSHFDPPDVAGRPALVSDAGTPRLWVLTRQEEARQVTVHRSSSRSIGGSRSDTFFHFEIQAFDPETARPLWKQRLLTLGDDEAQGTRPSRVIGSSAEGQLLGQDGGVVWLILDSEPWAVSATDGKPLAHGADLEARNPELKGVLPVDAKFYGFDQGLVVMTADARHVVIRGPEMKAMPYVATPTPVAPAEQMADVRERIVPLRLSRDQPARLVELAGRRIGLYSVAEAQDAANDELGDRLRYPYTILKQGGQVRRTFWNANAISTERFNETYNRFTDFTPINGAPGFLDGRFLTPMGSDDALPMDRPAGVLVWHLTRIDSAGRLALTRLDHSLRSLWTTELPISETAISPKVSYWLLPGRILIMGAQQNVDDGVTSWDTHVVTLAMADGARQAWSLQRGEAVP